MTTNNALITRSDIDQIIRCNAHAGRASWNKHPRSKVLAAAMLREEDFQPAQIPFVGFYESSISAVFDDAVNSEFDRYKDEGGWVPFYPEDVRRWGPVTPWDAAQLGVLLDFICPDRRLTEYGLDDRIRECVQELAGATFDEQIKARKAA